jgi:uncharacterized short protein YbdD (DUF466 family)
MTTWRDRWNAFVAASRRIFGVPDYDAYVVHLREHHPDVVPPTAEAFFADRLQARYGRGRSRCC